MPSVASTGRSARRPGRRSAGRGAGAPGSCACTGTWVSRASPATNRARPANSTVRGPKRTASRADTPSDTAPITSAVGSSQPARPRVSEHPLDIQADQHLEAERGRDDQRLGQVGPGAAGVARMGSGSSGRRARWPGGPAKAASSTAPSRQQAERAGRAPAGPGRLDQRGDAGHQAGGDQCGAQPVGAGPQPGAPVRQGAGVPADTTASRTDGEVDEEDPVPAHGLGQHAAEDQAERRPACADEAVRGHRPDPLRRLRVTG